MSSVKLTKNNKFTMKKNIFLLTAICATLSLSAQNNIQWRGGDRTGIYNETGLLKQWPAGGPQLLWHFDGLGEGHSSIAIDGGKIYATGMTDDEGFLYVFDLNGKLLNKVGYGKEWAENYNGPRGTVTVNEGKLYIITGTGFLICKDQNTLKELWRKDAVKDFDAKNITWGITESPLVVDNKVIFTPGGEKHNVVALNKNTGALIWSSAGKGELSAYHSPLYIANQQVPQTMVMTTNHIPLLLPAVPDVVPQIVVMTTNHIMGIDVANGNVLWSHEQRNQWSVHANTAVYDGKDMLLLTSGYGQGSVMLRLTNGGRAVESVWSSKDIDGRMGGMVKVGDYVYGSGDNNNYWFAVNWNTGETMYKASDIAPCNVVYADGMLYCYSDRGTMNLVKPNPGEFELISSFNVTLGTGTHWAHPVIHQGVMYIRHGGALMAYKV